MKKIIFIFSVALFISLLISQSSSTLATGQISVIVNGEKQAYSQAPILENNSVLVPLRGIFETLNAKVEWNENTQQIKIIKDDKTISLQIGQNTAKVNEETLNISSPPRLINNYTFVPLRFISESLGAIVNWSQDTYTVTITMLTDSMINKAEYYAYLSNEAIKVNNLEEALNNINNAIEINPTNHLFYYNRGLIYEKLGQKDKAFADFVTTTNLNNKYDQAFAKIGHIYLDQYKFNEALNAFSQAIEVNPNNEDSFVNRAYIYYKIKEENEKAISDISQAIKLNPDNKTYRALLNKYSEKTFDKSIVDYFITIATGDIQNNTIRRWEEEMKVALYGTPTTEDIDSVNKVANEINTLLGIEKIKVVKKDENPNVQIHLIPQLEFSDIEEDADKTKIGQFFVWNQDGDVINTSGSNLNESIILIAQDQTEQLHRDYLIRRYITQSLGLTFTSWDHEDSIFYSGEQPKQNFSALDKELLQILYYHELHPGMDVTSAREVLAD